MFGINSNAKPQAQSATTGDDEERAVRTAVMSASLHNSCPFN